MKGKFQLFVLSLSSALLLSLSWYWNLTLCIFFAFVPLLFVEDKISSSGASRSRLKVLGYAYLCFLTWNLLVTWWVVYASVGGACLAFLANSFLMSVIFVLFSAIKKRLNKAWGIWLLVPLWLAWEHVHTLWDLTWTWLTIGNVFAFKTSWVQWYEFTGTSGGTFWVLITNIFIFRAIKNRAFSARPVLATLKLAGFIVLPVALSFWIIMAYTFREINKTQAQKKPGVKVMVVQPNIDPYNVKFSMDYQSQFLKVMDLIRDKISDETKYLVLPETFITEDLDESSIEASAPIRWFKDSLLQKYPQLGIVTGANTYVFYADDQRKTVTARLDKNSGKYYDVFNSAVYLDRNGLEIYHKSKLVPGVERMPFPALLKPLEGLAINMGGTMGSLGTQEKRSVFSDSGVCIAPVVCYESVYADYVTEYLRKGANFIFIITNDGWWQDTPGYIQHLNYARLRAIENRRQIARSANTGISCFIDEFGMISEPTQWWKEAVIEKELRPIYELTFFSRFGDLLSYTSLTVSILLILWFLFLAFKK